MAFLKQRDSGSYMNAYEAAYHQYGSTKGFDQTEWEQEAREGNLDRYINMLSKSNDFDWAGMSDRYNAKYATPETRLAMKYNETYTDKSLESKKKRSVLKYNDDGTIMTDSKGVPVYEEQEMTDYEYYARTIKEANTQNMQKIMLEEKQAIKDARNWFLKRANNIGDIFITGAESGLSFLDSALAWAQGGFNALFALDGTTANFKEYFTEFADRWVTETNAHIGDISLEKLIGSDAYEAILEFEREHTDKYNVDGTPADSVYMNYVVPVVDTLSKAVVSRAISGGILGNIAGNAPGIERTASFATFSKALSTTTFYTYVTGQNIGEMYRQFAADGVSVPNGQILVNATLKSTLQAGAELVVDRVFGGATQFDNWLFGRKMSSVGTKIGDLRLSAASKILIDAIHEGTEEVLQDCTDWFVDRSFKLLNNCLGNPEIADEFGNMTQISMSSLFNTFVVAALTSLVSSTFAVAGTHRVSTGKIMYNKDGSIKYDEDGDAKYKKLTKLESYALDAQLQSMGENLNKLTEYYTDIDQSQIGMEYQTLKQYDAAIAELGKKIDEVTKQSKQFAADEKAKVAADTNYKKQTNPYRAELISLKKELNQLIQQLAEFNDKRFKTTANEAALAGASLEQQLQALRTEYASLKREYDNELERHSANIESKKEEYKTAFKAAYGSFRLLAKVATEMGDEEFSKTQAIIKQLDRLSGKEIVKAGAELKKQISEVLSFYYDKKGNLVKLSGVRDLEKVMKRLEDAAITEIETIVERGQNIDNLDVNDTTKQALKEVLADSDKTSKAIITKDGNKVIAIKTIDDKDVLFIPAKYAKNADGTIIYETLAEQELVENICAGNFKGLVLDTVLKTYREVSGVTQATLDEAVWNLIFNESFFTAMLSVSNTDMYHLLSSIKNIAEKTIAKDKREVAYVNKMKSIFKKMSELVYNYCILQPYASINVDILTKNQQRKIAAARWCSNLYARVINDTTFKQLTDNDWNVLNARVNSLAVDAAEKENILNLLKSAHSQDRQNAMNRINQVQYAMFTSAYDGTTYLPDTNNANRAFNVWLQNNGLTIKTLFTPSDELKQTVATLYKEFNADTLLQYYTDSFIESSSNKYSFLLNKQGVPAIYEIKTGKQVGFATYRANADIVVSGEAIDTRSIVTVGQKDNSVVAKLVDPNVDAATRAYLSIDDVVNDPSLLTTELRAAIQTKYGNVDSVSAFLYLRDEFAKTDKTRTLIVLGNGTYAFGEVRPMQSILVNKDFAITENTTINDIIDKKYLTGRLADVNIKMVDTLVDAAQYDPTTNTIYVMRGANKELTTFAVLHEFQHAIQVENQMNLGMYSSWLNCKTIRAKMRKQIIADIRKHNPQLFQNVAIDSEQEFKIANEYVYFASGETEAYGVRNSSMLDFYPVRVEQQTRGTILTMPWGTQYNISEGLPFSLVNSGGIFDFDFTAEERKYYKELSQEFYKELVGKSNQHSIDMLNGMSDSDLSLFLRKLLSQVDDDEFIKELRYYCATHNIRFDNAVFDKRLFELYDFSKDAAKLAFKEGKSRTDFKVKVSTLNDLETAIRTYNTQMDVDLILDKLFAAAHTIEKLTNRPLQVFIVPSGALLYRRGADVGIADGISTGSYLFYENDIFSTDREYSSRVLTHELLHYVTTSFLRLGPTWTKNFSELVNMLRKLSSDDLYAYTNELEMVAEYSSRTTRKILYSLDLNERLQAINEMISTTAEGPAKQRLYELRSTILVAQDDIQKLTNNKYTNLTDVVSQVLDYILTSVENASSLYKQHFEMIDNDLLHSTIMYSLLYSITHEGVGIEKWLKFPTIERYGNFVTYEGELVDAPEYGEFVTTDGKIANTSDDFISRLSQADPLTQMSLMKASQLSKYDAQADTNPYSATSIFDYDLTASERTQQRRIATQMVKELKLDQDHSATLDKLLAISARGRVIAFRKLMSAMTDNDESTVNAICDYLDIKTNDTKFRNIVNLAQQYFRRNLLYNSAMQKLSVENFKTLFEQYNNDKAIAPFADKLFEALNDITAKNILDIRQVSFLQTLWQSRKPEDTHIVAGFTEGKNLRMSLDSSAVSMLHESEHLVFKPIFNAENDTKLSRTIKYAIKMLKDLHKECVALYKEQHPNTKLPQHLENVDEFITLISDKSLRERYDRIVSKDYGDRVSNMIKRLLTVIIDNMSEANYEYIYNHYSTTYDYDLEQLYDKQIEGTDWQYRRSLNYDATVGKFFVIENSKKVYQEDDTKLMSAIKVNKSRVKAIQADIKQLFDNDVDANTMYSQLKQKYSSIPTDVLTDIYMSTLQELLETAKQEAETAAQKQRINEALTEVAKDTTKVTDGKQKAQRAYQEGEKETDVIKNTHVSETRKWIEKRPKLDANGNVIRNSSGQIVYTYVYPTKSRYVSQTEAKGTNLEKYGYTQKYKRTQMSDELKNFIVAASPSIAPELWNKVKSGKLTTQDVLDYLRDTAIKDFDNNTFQLINRTFFKNSKIKTVEDLDKFVTNTSQYYAMRAVIRAAGFGEALLNNASPDLLERLQRIIDNDPKLKKAYDGIVARYETYKGTQELKISEKYLRYLWMKYYDGTLEMAGYIATLAKAISIAGYQLTSEVRANTSLEATINPSGGKNGDDKEMTLADVLEDKGALDAFEAVLGITSREEKTSEILQVLLMKARQKHKNATYEQFAKYLQKARLQIEELSDKDFAKYYAKYVGNMTEEDFNAMYLKAFIAQSTGIDINELSDKKQNELEQMATGIAKKVTRNNVAIVNNIKSISRTIRANLTTKSKKLFLQENSDIFDERGYVKKELYQTTDSKGRIRLKPDNELTALEDRIRQLSKNVQAGDYTSKQALYWRQKFDKQIAKLQAENERLAREMGKGKSTVINVTVADDVLTIDANKEVPDALKRILATSFKTYAKSKTQYLANDGEMHIKMNLESFIKDNAELLTILTQADVDAIIDFYTSSDIVLNTNKSRQYMATEIYLGTYLLQANKLGKFLLTEEQRVSLENLLERIVSTAGAELAAWKAAKRMLDPVKIMAQSLAKKAGIEFYQEDINDVSKALESGSVTRIQAAKEKMYRNAMADYKGRKKTFLDKLFEFERMAMLSGPGTWVRNQASNVLVSAGNITGEQIGNWATRLITKLFPKSKMKKRDEVVVKTKQYKIIGTKVSEETQQWIKTQIIDSKFIDLISDGLSKYNPARFTEVSTSDNMVMMIINAVRADIYQNQTIAGNEVLTTMNKFIATMMSDNFWIKKAMIRYLGKILTEDNVDLSKGVQNKAVLEHIADAYVLAARDYMHKPNFMNDFEQLLREKLGTVGFFAYKQLMPFASASMNWLLEAMNYTPVGLAKAIIDFAKLEDTVNSLELARQRGEKVVSSRFADYLVRRRIGKGVIGTIGMAIGAALAAFGLAGIDDKDDKYKLRIGDVYVDISAIFGTQGILLGMALVGTCKGGNPWGMFATALGTMLEESTLSDLYNSFRYANSFGDALADMFVFDKLSMFVPNFVKQIASIANVYKVKYSKGILGKFEYAAVSSIPFLAYAMPKRYDPYSGEAQISYNAQFITNLANRLLPFKVYPYHVSEFEKEAISVGVNKGELTGKYTVNDKTVDLSTSDKSLLNEFYGKLNANELKELFANKRKYKVKDSKTGKFVELTYSRMTDEQKKNVIARVMSTNADYAKIYVLTSTGKYKYYATEAEYTALKKLGITQNVYRAKESKYVSIN